LNTVPSSRLRVPLRIPPIHRGPLRQFFELSSEGADAIIDQLGALPAFTATPELRRTVSEVWPRLSPAEAEAITLALISLAQQRSNWELDELARLVSESPDLEIPNERREQFGAVLQRLIELEVLATTAKALAVLTRHEHVFQDARIMTDIRPVFRDDPSERPTGAVIIHTLSLEHYTDGETRTFNVAMDAGDLAKLGAAIERATAKGGALVDVIESCGLALFEFQEADGE
jgi:hypothetical protein